MSINSDIYSACVARLKTLGYSPMPPIAWSNRNFTPPTDRDAMWLRADFFPNEPGELGWGNYTPHEVRGFFQVRVYYRPNIGIFVPGELAEDIVAHFAKGTELGPVRVVKSPWWTTDIVEEEGAMSFIPVTIEYLGICAEEQP